MLDSVINIIKHILLKKPEWAFFLLLDKPRSYITVDLIFYAPNVANLGFLRIVATIVPTIAF